VRLLFWPVRWAFFLLHLILYYLYGILVFFSKPFARIFVPAVAFAVLWYVPAISEQFIFTERNLAFLARWIPVDPNDTGLLVIVGLVFFASAFWFLSSLLRPVLGATPPMRRPMPPMLRLQARDRMRPPAPARVAVPIAGGRRRLQPEKLLRRLPPGLRALLAPTETKVTEKTSNLLNEIETVVQTARPPPPKPQPAQSRRPPPGALPHRASTLEGRREDLFRPRPRRGRPVREAALNAPAALHDPHGCGAPSPPHR